jgi:ribonuclease HII
MANNLVCGLDEAGRGPVLGPMVLCGMCFEESNLKKLDTLGVKDSKKLTAQKRDKLAEILKKSCVSYKVSQLSPQEIDQRVEKRISLNKLEINNFVAILEELKPDIIYIDAADTDEKRFGSVLKNHLTFTPKKVISKHKADDLFPIVGAASIIAKTKRDDVIKKLKAYYIDKGSTDIGSGYPSDEKTITFLREWIQTHKKAPSCARKTWATTKKILNEEVYNKKITQYFT